MTPINSAMPPLKRARSAEGPIREKRPASVRHEGPKKKKVKTAAIEPEKLSDREIKISLRSMSALFCLTCAF
jgi:hypothetical protein